ncbi:MAG: hypothetical protein JXO72_14820 [Vicinamibacteria bacterium]|nr:hypothetical protein [Vicinamibacteria bacterium]
MSSVASETPTSVEPSALNRLVEAVLPIEAETSLLAVNLEHSLKNGRIRLWVDEDVVLDEPLAAPVKKKVLLYRSRKGRLEETFEIEPGEHVVRVRFDWDDNVEIDSIQGHFVSSRTRYLSINLGGLIKKRLKLKWE